MRFISASALAASLLLAATATAQTLSPPLVEYEERGRASFQVSNPTLFPLTVVLQPRGFEVDEMGVLKDIPFDTTKVKLKLSTMSVRLAPRQTYTVFYEASADSAPAWFAVMAAFTGGRTQNGIAVRIELPHVVYLGQRTALPRGDVHIREFRHDAAAKKVWVKVENTGPALGRAREVNVAAGSRSAELGAFPVFPRSSRWVSLDWPHAEAPQRAMVRFDGFRLESTQPAVPGAP